MTWDRIQIIGICSAVGIVVFSVLDRDFIGALGWVLVALYQAERIRDRPGHSEDTPSSQSGQETQP